jgi:hypothetical protein
VCSCGSAACPLTRITAPFTQAGVALIILGVTLVSVFGPASSHGVTEQAISRTDLNRNPKPNPNPNPDLRSHPNVAEQEIMNDFQKPGFGLFAGTSLLTVTLWARRAAHPTPPMPTPTRVAPPLACTPCLRACRAYPTLPYPRAPPLARTRRPRARRAYGTRHVRAALHRQPDPVATCAR